MSKWKMHYGPFLKEWFHGTDQPNGQLQCKEEERMFLSAGVSQRYLCTTSSPRLLRTIWKTLDICIAMRIPGGNGGSNEQKVTGGPARWLPWHSDFGDTGAFMTLSHPPGRLSCHSLWFFALQPRVLLERGWHPHSFPKPPVFLTAYVSK